MRRHIKLFMKVFNFKFSFTHFFQIRLSFLKVIGTFCDCFFVSKQLVQRLHLYIINIFNVLRKVDIVFNTVVINITFLGIIILKISMFEGKMNFKGILVKFLLMNIAIKQFILKVFNFKFLSLIFSDNISCFKICL